MIFYSMLIEKSLDDNFLFKLKHPTRQIPPLKTHISLLEKLWEEVEVGVKVAVKVASSVHLWPVRKRSDAHQGRTRKAGRVDSRRQRVPGGDGIDGGSEAPKRLTDGRARHGRLLLAARHATTGVITHFKA